MAARTRLYFQNAAPDFTPTNNRGAWDQTTSSVSKKLGQSPAGASTTVAIAETSATNNFDVLLGKWISDAISHDMTISGLIDMVIAFSESNTAANDFLHIHVYVTAGDTDTVRGTLLSNVIDTTDGEWPTTIAFNYYNVGNASAVAASKGDRIVVEIGYQAQNTSTTSRTGTMRYGGTNNGDADGGGAVTSYVPFIVITGDLFGRKSTNKSMGRPVLNKQHPLAKGLMLDIPLFEGGGLRDLVDVQRNNKGIVIMENDLSWIRGPDPKKSFWALRSIWGTGGHIRVPTSVLGWWQNRFSIAFWIRQNRQVTGDQGVIDNQWGGVHGGIQGLIGGDSNNLSIRAGSSTTDSSFVTAGLTQGKWHRIVFTGTTDGSNGTIAIYRDGALIASTAVTTTLDVPQADIFILTALNDQSGVPMIDVAGPIRFYRRTLSNREIREDFKNPLAAYERFFNLPLFDSMLGKASGLVTNTKTFTVDGIIQVQGNTKTFTVDGIVLVQTTKTFTVDGIVFATNTSTFTVDGIVFATNTKTFTVDGIVQVQGNITTFTVDGIVLVQTTKTFTVDGIVLATTLATFTVDGVIQVQGNTKTFTVDAIVQTQGNTSTFTVDGIVLATQTKTFTVDGIIFATNTSTFTVDGIVFATNTKTFTVDGIVLVTTTATFTVDGIVQTQGNQKTFTVDGIILVTTSATFTVDGIIFATNTLTFTVDGIIRDTGTLKTFTVDGIIFATNTFTFTVDGIIQVQGNLFTFTVDGIVLAQTTKTFTVDGIILVQTTATFTVDGIVQTQGNIKTFTVDGIILVQTTATFTVDGIIQVQGNTQTFTVDGIVKSLESITFTVDGIVLVVTDLTFTVDGIIQATQNSTFTVDGVIVNRNNVSFTIDGVIIAQLSQSITFTIDGIIVDLRTSAPGGKAERALWRKEDANRPIAERAPILGDSKEMPVLTPKRGDKLASELFGE